MPPKPAEPAEPANRSTEPAAGARSTAAAATKAGAAARSGTAGRPGKSGATAKTGATAEPGTPAKGAVPARAGTAASATTIPVRAGEESWTGAELSEIRERLEVEHGDLRREIARAESEIADRMGDVTDGAGDDQADAGAKTYAREHEMALTYNARDLLAQNERALERIDGGTYGVCESCGQPIGKARLQAFPRATLCVKCKQREERR